MKEKTYEFVSPEAGDWVCLLIDGKIAAEGHSLRATDILDTLDIKYTCREIEDDNEDGDKWWAWRNQQEVTE